MRFSARRKLDMLEGDSDRRLFYDTDIRVPRTPRAAKLWGRFGILLRDTGSRIVGSRKSLGEGGYTSWS